MRVFLGAALLAILTSPVSAQTEINSQKPVRIVVPFAPGGSNDVVARMLAQKWEGKVGSAVVVENRAGAGGNIGTEWVSFYIAY